VPETPRLSAVLIVQNEQRYLEACLESLRGLADEIVVLDGGSTDATIEIAGRFGAQLHRRPFDDFGRQKQAALDLARGDWVLSIDADERVTPALATEIRGALGNPSAAGYWIRREQIYLGARLRFGGTGNDWVLRLARRDVASFTQVPVHERLVVQGNEERLRGTMDHIKYQRLAEHVETINHYTDLAASQRAAKGRRFAPWHLLRIPLEVFYRLLARGGILDGRAGIIYAAMSAFYVFLKHAKLYPDERAPR
jgi:glycosyltransferase involved in cell wall biosynthesis